MFCFSCRSVLPPLLHSLQVPSLLYSAGAMFCVSLDNNGAIAGGRCTRCTLAMAEHQSENIERIQRFQILHAVPFPCSDNVAAPQILASYFVLVPLREDAGISLGERAPP